ncbi:hypothetical protein LOK49_LG08G01944 [Camellia lanceoleosa]|uniref:Uncharacterized protein n=1 Tax=Camellia lanceoleosa TaxID=1840588 RepID=A0ACC0GUF7_9ERIC|nr:hypothetical protein LOK49_LG08G01944 [Camellia lanceoleosa]
MANYLVLSSSIVFFLFIAFFSCFSNTTDYNVLNFGAKLDEKSDSTQEFHKAWGSACNSTQAATIYVPRGRFLLKNVVFRGPSPSDYRAIGDSSGYWILFVQVNSVGVIGGTLDAKGGAFCACRTSGKNCPVRARANNILISGLTLINSQLSHTVINSCNNVMVCNVKIIALDQSPNTDGIHVQLSIRVTISGSSIRTEDDCISIGSGTRNLWMKGIQCGLGHGISIGSLAKELNEDGVQNITLTKLIFAGSDNGVRIKSWARPSKAFVRDISFQNILMRNVQNPIIIDQNYCPNNQGCPSQSSGVKISEVTYKNIHGTSATQVAVTFDCSPSNPCKGIRLQDIKLSYLNKPAQASCRHIGGTSIGVIVPQSCL